MATFQDFDVSKQLQYAIEDLGFETPTPIQEQSFSIIRSGKDVVGIAQTGTGKTFAYMLPLLRDLKFSKQINPRILVLVPTRELVIQVVEQIELFAKYINVRIVGVYGGVNMNTQAQSLQQGADIVVATPGRLYDLVLSRALQLKAIKKLVIDEVDVMLDLGFRYQITNIFELLPEQRQNIMFSATMTDDVNTLIDDFFIAPHKISIAVSGTPLENISQTCYAVPNFYTKVNLLTYLLKDKETYSKVLVFITNKRLADRLFESLQRDFGEEVAVIHSNKTQNYRIRSIENFNTGENRILIATDVIARGLDLDMITHVFNFNTPNYPENYMHRIGRAGRAKAKGNAILFYTEKEKEYKEAIETLMNYEIPQVVFPDAVTISSELAPEEQTKIAEINNPSKEEGLAKGFHEKKEKNKKTNQGGSYRREIAKKYKKPKTRGDKNYNRRNKNKKR
ncbi:DEAD/DEAH box helicase [Kordia zhangzhouensis]|uniref:DEAD/DEAH box helicase n=1 Tax=Kordia zhangzhouensis TaxID=1620405 RepID=UPI0006290840|nr:DEAD/DEAH box helicase [Kordia zhangzhouensis]